MRLIAAGRPNASAWPSASSHGWDDGAPVAFMLITDPASEAAPDESVLAALFGFSPAEVRVAGRLMRGEAPEELARALNIRISTVRWHLASLYRKTGTSRQSELVRLLMSLPAIDG